MLRINDAADIEVVDNLGKGDFCHLCDEFCVGVCLGEQRKQDILLIQTG